MSVIENFAELSAQEQKAFAEALVKTINSEHIFHEYAEFKIDYVEADDLTGDLIIAAETADKIYVEREATWTCGDADEAYEKPDGDVDYKDDLFGDIKKTLKTLSTTIEGYTITMELADAEDYDPAAEVEVDSISDEDDGIGSYEHFGYRGYDSHPYVEVKGTLTKDCDFSFAFVVEPTGEPAVETTPEEN